MVCKFWILMILARSTKNHPLHLLEHSQGCWAGHHPCLEFVQWTLSWGKPIWGFTPVCTVAKGLEVALASQHLSMSQNYQTQTFTSTEASWLIITSQCYIKWVSAESVCCSSHLRMDSDSVSNSPGPGWLDRKLESENGKDLAIWTVTIQGIGIGGSCCCCDYVVEKKDIRDPLDTMRSLFVSFRFINLHQTF